MFPYRLPAGGYDPVLKPVPIPEEDRAREWSDYVIGLWQDEIGFSTEGARIAGLFHAYGREHPWAY